MYPVQSSDDLLIENASWDRHPSLMLAFKVKGQEDDEVTNYTVIN